MACLQGSEPPAGLAKKVALKEEENQRARENYTYRQTVLVEEMDPRGSVRGSYREVRDIIFSPERRREEHLLSGPLSTLQRLQLTEQDFRDIREVQPFLFTEDLRWRYLTRYRGEEAVDAEECYVLEVNPRQVLEGQRLFEGLLWVSEKDYSIVRSAGKAVPEIRSTKTENLFPRFTTNRKRVDGEHWFPALTLGDDVLDFKSGPLRIRLKIEYTDYKRFRADSTVTFEDPAKKP